MFGDDPFFGGRGSRSSRGRDGRGERGQGALSLFDGDDFFGGGGMGAGRGFGSMLGGNLMQQMDELMQGGLASGGDGTVFSSSSVMTMSRGADGKMQQYSSQTRSTNVGGQRVSETKQAYSNNAGLDKVGWEKTIGDRGTKVVKERQRGSGQETTTKLFHGMDPEHGQEFEREWRGHEGRRALGDFGARVEHNVRPMLQQFGGGGLRSSDSRRERSFPHDSVGYRRHDRQQASDGYQIADAAERGHQRRHSRTTSSQRSSSRNDRQRLHHSQHYQNID